ncbi:MAG: FMN-binding protein [Desulfobacteraceae bacterium]|jgi:electron transport complex protein RnfG|nr:MAG: FMN-binding protein [Desulfobacteraceae bacterium]
MKEIFRITIGLTISCLVAAVIMGSVFAITDKAKKHNEHVNVQDTMLGLLGFNKDKPAPRDLRFFSIYRYTLDDSGATRLAYMVPVLDGGKEKYELVVITPAGEFVERFPLKINPEAANEGHERELALRSVLRPSTGLSFADSAILAVKGKERLAYLLPSEFPGFKTFIKVILALDPMFTVIGLEIMEHEEDPGLGAEIVQPYFKHQFRGKSFDRLRELKVIKEPLPDEYKTALEKKAPDKGGLSKADLETLRDKYRDEDIYAITGATISSNAVTSGVINAAKKFSYRLKTLEKVIAAQRLAVSF